MKVAVKTLDNKNAGEIELDESIFGLKNIREDILYRMVKCQLNKRQQGSHKVKERSDLSGTGKKPWAQKGTGRARAGDLKRPQDRGGVTCFGPVVRSHATDLPKKQRQLALKTALSAKVKDGKLIILENAKTTDHKTKTAADKLKKFGFESVLIVDGKIVDTNFQRATSNLPKVDLLPSQGANVYDILRRDVLVLTKDAVADLTERLKG